MSVAPGLGFHTADDAAQAGQLEAYMRSFPREKWNPEDWLARAAAWGDHSTARLLLEHGAPREFALWEAARKGSLSMIQLLLSKGPLTPSVYGLHYHAMRAATRNEGENGRQCVDLLVLAGINCRLPAYPYGDHHLAYAKRRMHGRKACVRAAIALLTTKKKHGSIWRFVDRFLIRQVALATWQTRLDEKWSE